MDTRGFVLCRPRVGEVPDDRRDRSCAGALQGADPEQQFHEVGIVVGVPAGIAVGRVVWDAFAGNLGVPSVPVVSVGDALAAAGTILVANVLAIAPALFAVGSRPAFLLKAE